MSDSVSFTESPSIKLNSVDPPPTSMLRAFFCFGRRFAQAIAPNYASFSPLIILIFSLSSFFTLSINSFLFGASRSAEVATHKSFLTLNASQIVKKLSNALKVHCIGNS